MTLTIGNPRQLSNIGKKKKEDYIAFFFEKIFIQHLQDFNGNFKNYLRLLNKSISILLEAIHSQQTVYVPGTCSSNIIAGGEESKHL